MATAADAFELVAFAGGVWSWSAAYAAKRALLASTLTPHCGRQAGGRPPSAGQMRPAGALNGGERLQRLHVCQRLHAAQQERRPWSPMAAAARRPASAGGGLQRCSSSGGTCQAGDGSRGRRQRATVDSVPSPRGSVNWGGSAWAQAGWGDGGAPAGPPTGGAARPGSADMPQSCTTGPVPSRLQPCSSECLADARTWVDAWPSAVGSTRLLAALQAAERCGGASCGSGGGGSGLGGGPDCWYLLSDGLADDAAECLRWVEARRLAGRPLPPVHTVGEDACPQADQVPALAPAWLGVHTAGPSASNLWTVRPHRSSTCSLV